MSTPRSRRGEMAARRRSVAVGYCSSHLASALASSPGHQPARNQVDGPIAPPSRHASPSRRGIMRQDRCCQRLCAALSTLFYCVVISTKAAESYPISSSPSPSHSLGSRRNAFSRIAGAAAVTLTVPFVVCSSPTAAAAATLTKQSPEDDVQTLRDASDVLGNLLGNWERATVDCTYADIPRELLQQKNKEELLEKASTFALFDKSTSVVSCKTNNRVVRDYLGATGKGPLVGIEKRVLRLADVADPDRLDDYLAETEHFSQTLSGAVALSWFAGHNDFDAMNNFAKGEQQIREDSNLEQSRRAIGEAKVSLDTILKLLP